MLLTCLNVEDETERFDQLVKQHQDKCRELENKLIAQHQDVEEGMLEDPQALLARTTSQIKVMILYI